MTFLGTDTAGTLIWCFAIGVVFACLYAFYAKAVVGKLVRALAAANATDEDSALSPAELGCDGVLYRFIMRKGFIQEGAVASTADGRYYMKEESREKLLSKFGKDSSSVLSLFFALLIIAVAVVALAAAYPTFSDKIGAMWN